MKYLESLGCWCSLHKTIIISLPLSVIEILTVRRVLHSSYKLALWGKKIVSISHLVAEETAIRFENRVNRSRNRGSGGALRYTADFACEINLWRSLWFYS